MVNAQAGLFFWYTNNIVEDIASVSTVTDSLGSTSYSLVPYTTGYNVTAAILALDVTFVDIEETTFDPVANTTGYYDNYIMSTPPLPAAVSTLYLTQSDVGPLPNSTIAATALNSLFIDAVTPSFVVPAATPFIASASTDAVYYTGYEVEYLTATTGTDGLVSCVTTTSTYLLNQTYAFEYDDLESTLGSQLVATGTLDPSFLNMIPQSTCTAGVFVAPQPTMLVVIEITYFRGFQLFLVHHEISTTGALVAATTSNDDSGSAPTEASGDVGNSGSDSGSDSSDSGSSGNSGGSGGGNNGASIGQGVANVGGQDTTLLVTFTGGQHSATVTVDGHTVVASAASNGLGDEVASAVLGALGYNSGSNSGNSGSSGSGGSGSGTVDGVGYAPENPVGGSSNSGSGSSGSGSPPGGAQALPDTNGSGGSSGGSGGSGGSSDSQTGQQGGSSPPPPIISVGGQGFTPNAATQYYLAPGQTLTPGGTASVNGETVSLASNAAYVVVGGQTQGLQGSGAATTPPPIDVSGTTYEANSQGAYVIQGQTLTPGGEVIVGSNTISLGNGYDSLVVNGITITSPPAVAVPTYEPAITLAGNTFTANNGGQSFIISGQTLTPGGVITAYGSTISLEEGGNPTVAVVNGQTETLDSFVTAPAIVVGGTTYTESNGASFVIAGQTVRPGQTIVVSGTTVAVASNGQYITINGITSELAGSTIPVLDIGGTSFAATSGPSDEYIIGGQTLYPGGPAVTYMGSTISLLPGGTAIVVNGKTTYMSNGITTNPPLITFDGTVFTANSGTTFVIDGMTLTPGGTITVSGTVISLSPYATDVVIGGKTTTLFPATTPASNSATATPISPTTSVSPTATHKKGAASKEITPSTALSISTFFATLLMVIVGWL